MNIFLPNELHFASADVWLKPTHDNKSADYVDSNIVENVLKTVQFNENAIGWWICDIRIYKLREHIAIQKKKVKSACVAHNYSTDKLVKNCKWQIPMFVNRKQKPKRETKRINKNDITAQHNGNSNTTWPSRNQSEPGDGKINKNQM